MILARRDVLAMLIAAPLAACTSERPAVQVWKTSSCGCCGDWVRHLEANGFDVRVNDVAEPAVYRRKFGIPDALASCHTAKVANYALEGHVPAREIHRLLRERPEVVGLAVPAMPLGSPGMDGPEYGNRKDAYDVLVVARHGEPRVYESYR